MTATIAAASAAETHETDTIYIERRAPGWRCVWLPRHGEFLAFLDVDMADGGTKPSARGPTADRVLSEIRSHSDLCSVVREYLALRGAA